MKQTVIPMKADAKVVIRAGADVMVEGGAETQMVAIVEDGESFRMKDENGVIFIRTDSETKLRIPATAFLTLERVGGDSAVRNFSQSVIVAKVGGDLTLQNIADASIESVGGDCYFKNANGNITINRVGGDLDGNRVNQFTANQIGGDMELSDIKGKAQATVGGDVRLQLGSLEISETRIRAGGNIHLAVIEGAKAMLNLSSGGEEISVHACGQHLDVEKGAYTLPLGEGGATVELVAGDKISVREGKESMGEFSFVFDDLEDSWKDFGKEIEERIRHSMKGMNHSLRQAGWQASDTVRRAAEKLENLSINVDDTPRGKENKVYGFTFDNAPGQAEKKEKKAASDEERMLVLKMLQEKKITVEEAEKLLQSLEG